MRTASLHGRDRPGEEWLGTLEALLYYSERQFQAVALFFTEVPVSDPMAILSPEAVDRIQSAVSQNPRKMTLQLARELGVPELAIIRALPDNRAVELDIGRWEELIRSLEALGKVHVIVSNGGATLEAIGQFGNFSTWGEFFNVQTKTLDMHIRWPELAAAFAVEKPGHMDGVNTLSFQFFDKQGAAAFKVFLTFGGSVPPPERVAQFIALRDQFRLR
jgi:putative heme iron utilization protein